MGMVWPPRGPGWAARRLRLIMNLPASNVLLVEDDPKMHEVLSALLHEDNITLTNAASAEQALAMVREKPYDLMLLDLGLPGLNGFEVLRRLRQDRRAVNLRTLVITAKNLRPPEKAYLHRKLASLVGKGEADLEYFSQIVNRTLKAKSQEEVPLSAGQS